MSIQAVAWVLSQKGEDLPGTARLVMISLANHADHTSGHCWPSLETIASEAGCSERTASRYVHAMRRNGFVDLRQTQRANGKFKSNDYWIIFDRKTAPWRYYEKDIDEFEDDNTVALVPHANLSDGHSETDATQMAYGPHATVGIRQESRIEPSESEPSAPAGFDPKARTEQQAKLRAAEEARKLQRIPVIEGSRPWDAHVKAGHPPALTATIEVNGKRYRGWYFETLYPKPPDDPELRFQPKSTGPPTLLRPEDEEHLDKHGLG